MNIFFAINDGYAEQLAVTMVSILETNQNTKIHFYVLSSDMSDQSKTLLSELKKHYSNFDIDFTYVDESNFKNLKLTISHISKETYYRYIIPSLFPDMDKALYLDADLVVNGSLQEFYDTNLDGYYCAGVEDIYVKSLKTHKELLGLKKDDLYINAGVMLLNASKIRQDDMIEKLFDNTVKYKDITLFLDQDILNITFNQKIKEVSELYNFAKDNQKANPENIFKAVIVHYNGKVKPWNEKEVGKRYRSKAKKIWITYYNKCFKLLDIKKIKTYSAWNLGFKLKHILRKIKAL